MAPSALPHLLLRGALRRGRNLQHGWKLQLSRRVHISTSTMHYGTSTHIFLEIDHLCTMLTNIGLFFTPVPMLDNPFSEIKFPNIQSKPPLAQLEAISSCPITCYLGEETDPHLTTTSFQTSAPDPSPASLPFFGHAPAPQCLSGSGGPKTEHSIRDAASPGDDQFPTPADYTISDTSQDAIGFLGHLGTLLAHIQEAVSQHPQVLFCWAAFQPLFPKPVVLHGVAVAQVQDLAFSLVEPHTIDLSPSIQPVQVPLQSLPTLQQINTPTQLGVICKLTEGALDPFVQIIDKDIKQDWPQHRVLGDTTCGWPPTGVNSIHHHSLGPAIQPVFYPVKSTPVQAMSSQFLQENAVGNHVGHLVIEGDQVGQAGSAFAKPMLAGLDPLVILYMPSDGTQDDVLHQLPWYR
ncbi:hypothetical protein QYF61_000808, partial [Mycteria americana]